MVLSCWLELNCDTGISELFVYLKDSFTNARGGCPESCFNHNKIERHEKLEVNVNGRT